MGIFKKLKRKFQGNGDNYKTSLTDTYVTEFPPFCERAATDDAVFAHFRTQQVYTTVLEHVSGEMGQQYLDIILQSNLLNESHFEVLRQNDLYGGASIRYYKEIGYMCPSTLRYIKVLVDLMKRFGDLNGKDICEIGVGYGGQARVIMALFDVKSYTLVDLDSVLSLSKKYLSHFENLKADIRFMRMEDLQERDYDLCISNYAFSELRQHIQDVYIAKIIRHAKHGYITFNNIAPQDFNYPLEQYGAVFQKEIHVSEEIPCSHPLNKIITW